ncbi:DUF1493 family protein [Franconibacter sp. IITDAS19]|uniref:DUF1493 family protein n=1 Tax=Franconibacter sp. IITDAS19 TaxID=2930569 RepID=UPI001FFBDF4A|nr:DUF1493 family protein [Franconibacter sp. IITDAS19]MCK1968935.1 DUF1493 family protein [Franconibacter sp. IITDAS19]
MVNNEEVLSFFRKELPVLATLRLKPIPLEMNDVLQEYAPADDLVRVINKYSEHFNVDISALNFDNYYPWEIPWFFRKWFTTKTVNQVSLPLTVKMFADSARAGKWLFD